MLFKKVDNISSETISSALELFSIPATDVTATKSQFIETLSLNPPSESPISFKISGTSSFIDLSKCYLSTILHLEKKRDENWVRIEAADMPSLINGCGITIFENIKISIQQREVYNSNRLSPFKCFMDMLLCYGNDASNTHLQAAGFYNENTVNDHNDPAFVERRELFNLGKQAEFVSRIYSDVFMIDRYLLGNLDLEVELVARNYDRFCIQAPTGDANVYRFVIDSCRLFVKTVDISDNLSLSISKALSTQVVRYPIRRSVLKSMVISSGKREYSATLFNENLPRRVTLALVNHRTFTGQNNDSPFNFEHGHIQSISISGGQVQVPYSSYRLDFERGKYVRAYHDLMENIGFAFSNSSNTISRKKFANGFTIFSFNLTSSLEDQANFELIKNSSTTVNIHFKQDVPDHAYELIIYAEFDGLLTVDSGRNIATDIGA